LELSILFKHICFCFTGHAKGEDMVKHFIAGLGGLDKSKLLQIGMDGPNVNWKFFDIIQRKLQDEFGSTVLNIGSCGLHIVHNSFKAGFSKSGWNIGDFLGALFYLFKDSPARRDDFFEITGSTTLPLKFVQHRWLENVPVVERAIQILPNVNKYIKAVEEKKLPHPGNKSFDTVKEHCKDALILTKLHFFKFIALKLQPFLISYQTNRPMICFLGDDLCALLRSLMSLFMLKDKIEKSDSKLAKTDVSDKSLYCNYKAVDMGFSAGKSLSESSVSDRQKMEVKMSARDCLVEIVKKLLTKAPVAYALVRHLSCLNPVNMSKTPDLCKVKFRRLLAELLKTKQVKENECDDMVQEYSSFLDSIPVIGRDKFEEFNKNQQSVDEFFRDVMSSTQFVKLYELVKVLLLLSHGQAAVERGFSVNKEVEVENLKHQSLIAQRIICDYVSSVGGILNVPVTEPMLKEARSARQKYETYLENERKKKKSQESLNTRKRQLNEIEEYRSKKQKLESSISELVMLSEKLYEKAESTGKIDFVSQANAMRRVMKEKQQQVIELEEKIKNGVDSLKKL